MIEREKEKIRSRRKERKKGFGERVREKIGTDDFRLS